MAEIPHVGVAAVIAGPGDDQTVLMGLRQGALGAGTWAFPGGHLEHGESFFTCAERETLEETGLHVRAKRVVAVTNNLIPAANGTKHYVALFVLCENQDPQTKPELREPDRCGEWRWVSWTHLRANATDLEPRMPLFLPITNLLNSYPALEKSLI